MRKSSFEKYFDFKNCIVWDKMWFGMGNNWRYNFELIMYGVKGWNGKIPSNNKSNVLRHRRISAQKLRHIAEKPIPLLEEIMEEHEGIVLDPFMGSGAVAEAAEKKHRKWVGIEIEEQYCKDIVERLNGITNTLFGEG